MYLREVRGNDQAALILLEPSQTARVVRLVQQIQLTSLDNGIAILLSRFLAIPSLVGGIQTLHDLGPLFMRHLIQRQAKDLYESDLLLKDSSCGLDAGERHARVDFSSLRTLISDHAL